MASLCFSFAKKDFSKIAPEYKRKTNASLSYGCDESHFGIKHLPAEAEDTD